MLMAAQAEPIGWIESLETRRACIEQELDDPDTDHEFWSRELIAIEDAKDQFERFIAPIEREIAALQNQRKLLLQGISATLEKRHRICNIAVFLGRDDPAGYLHW